MMRGTRWSGWAILVATSSVSVWHLAEAAESPNATAKTKKQMAVELKEQSEATLREAIGKESIGEVEARDASLDKLIEGNPDFAPARWQRGYIKMPGEWQHIDELANSDSETGQDVAYRNLRQKTPDTLAGNLTLANWCKKHGMKEAARGHWKRVLSFDATNRDAHLAIGDAQVNGVWKTSEEISEAHDRAIAVRNAIRKLKRNISEWAEGYAKGSEAKKQLCETKLREIRDPAAIPLLAWGLSTRGEGCELLLADMLKSMPILEATHALSDLGVRTDSDAVRQKVAAELRTRDEHAVIPPLLLAMSTPITSEMKLEIGNEGALVYRHVFSRENQRQIGIRSETTKFATVSTDLPGLGGLNNPFTGAERTIAAVSALAGQNQAEVAQKNLAIEEVNDRVSTLLSQVTNTNNSQPEDWWQWWNDQQQIQLPDGKQILTSDGIQQVLVSNQRRHECFVKGTAVWTSRGKVAIETLRTGDLVLSQDLKTGELAFKSVIQPTRRTPTSIYELEIGSAKLQCTAGHAFWVTGKGWTKAMDLSPGMLVRCADGSKPVLAVTRGEDVETHNLIVDDFHSYFVGDAKTLCHDNTDVQPTLAIAPGVYREGEAPYAVRP
jgi:hypothetical protein